MTCKWKFLQIQMEQLSAQVSSWLFTLDNLNLCSFLQMTWAFSMSLVLSFLKLLVAWTLANIAGFPPMPPWECSHCCSSSAEGPIKKIANMSLINCSFLPKWINSLATRMDMSTEAAALTTFARTREISSDLSLGSLPGWLNCIAQLIQISNPIAILGKALQAFPRPNTQDTRHLDKVVWHRNSTCSDVTANLHFVGNWALSVPKEINSIWHIFWVSMQRRPWNDRLISAGAWAITGAVTARWTINFNDTLVGEIQAEKWNLFGRWNLFCCSSFTLSASIATCKDSSANSRGVMAAHSRSVMQAPVSTMLCSRLRCSKSNGGTCRVGPLVQALNGSKTQESSWFQNHLCLFQIQRKLGKTHGFQKGCSIDVTPTSWTSAVS